MKLSMEYHNNYLEYMVQGDGWDVVSLSGYREVAKLFDYPMYIEISISHLYRIDHI